MNINEFLVKRFHISKEDASNILHENRVFINEQKAVQRQQVLKTDLISCDGDTLQDGVKYTYYAYYKPRGIECTLNSAIPNNLLEALPFKEHLYPVGRLDKESEGLLLLTNDGKLYKEIALSENHKEKEYLVEVDTELSEDALLQLTTGIKIMGQMTRSAKVTRISPTSFTIVLTQGLNRQIRRMCYKLGLEVMMLKRIRITSILIETLTPGEYRIIDKNDFF